MSNRVAVLTSVVNAAVSASATYTTPNVGVYDLFYVSGYVNSTAAGSLNLDFTNVTTSVNGVETPDWTQPFGSTTAQAVAAGTPTIVPAVVPAGRFARARFVNGAAGATLTLSLTGIEDT